MATPVIERSHYLSLSPEMIDKPMPSVSETYVYYVLGVRFPNDCRLRSGTWLY